MRKKKERAAKQKGDKKEVEGECGKLPFWEWEDLPYDMFLKSGNPVYPTNAEKGQ